MAGQALLASAVIAWKKNKAHSASADHWSIPFPDVMIQVIHSVERQYECAWWINVLWVNWDVTVSSHLLWCTCLRLMYVKYELLWKNRNVYTSNNHGRNVWGMNWMLWGSFKYQPEKEPWCVCFRSCTFESLFHDCWCLIQNFRRVFEEGSVVVWLKRMVNHHGLHDWGQTHLA